MLADLAHENHEHIFQFCWRYVQTGPTLAASQISFAHIVAPRSYCTKKVIQENTPFAGGYFE